VFTRALICVLIPLSICWAADSNVNGKSPYKLFEEANRLMEGGDNAGAIDHYTEALRSNELDHQNRATIILSRAQALISANRVRLASKDVATVMRMSGLDGVTRSTALWIRGQAGLKRKQYQLALQDFTDSIKIHHDDYGLRAATYASRGLAFLNMDKHHRAISDLNQAIELDDSLGYAYACRAMARLKTDELEGARRDCRRALRLEPYGNAAELANRVIKELAIPTDVKSSLSHVSVPVAENGHVYVRMKFGNMGRYYRFMVDTGATTTVLKREILEEIKKTTKVKAIGKGRVITADGAKHRVTRYAVKNAYIFHLPIGEIEALVFDNKSANVMQVLGVKALKDVTINIDSGRKKARIALMGNLMGR
jgi:tetratricopeptide (TPR) repeat protein